VQVRAYQARDADACRRLFEELVETHRRLYPDGDIGSTFAPEGDLFVAVDGDEVVAFAGLIRHGRRAELEPIVVAASHRGRGAGRAVVEHVVGEARRGGAIRLFARPVGRNADAIAFFHAVGLDVLARVEVQIDLDARARRDGETLGGRTFRV
jgi:GNAT superfamily N-acetyltransferase